MGVNYLGEIKVLICIVELDYGMIINVGKVYLEGFGFFEGVIKIKGELYEYLCYNGKYIIFIDKDNEYFIVIFQGFICICYGMEGGEGFYISGKLGVCVLFFLFEWEYEGQKFEVNIYFIGSYNMKNVLVVIMVGWFFSVLFWQICEVLEVYVFYNNCL